EPETPLATGVVAVGGTALGALGDGQASQDPMPPVHSPSIAGDLEPLLRTRKDRVSIEDVLGRVEAHEGLAPVVFVLTLPVLLPLPPGLSMIMALPVLMAA